jgi:hypothetical protein
MNDDVRPMNVVQTPDLIFVDEIELASSHDHDALRRNASLQEVPDDGRTQKPGPTGDYELLVWQNGRHRPAIVIGSSPLVIASVMGERSSTGDQRQAESHDQ